MLSLSELVKAHFQNNGIDAVPVVFIGTDGPRIIGYVDRFYFETGVATVRNLVDPMLIGYGLSAEFISRGVLNDTGDHFVAAHA